MFLKLQVSMLGMFCAQVLMTRPREEWRQDVSGRYKVLEHFSKEDARLQFLRILRSLPYGAPAPRPPQIPYSCCHACCLTPGTPAN